MLYENRDKINKVLAEWNPLGVPDELATEEYTSYISTIIRFANDEKQLKNYLEQVLIDDLATGYDKSKKEHYEDLEKVVKKLHEIM